MTPTPPKPDTNFLSGTAKPGPYKTALPMLDEMKFQGWVKANNVPFDDSPQSDYDMRGFWKAAQNGDRRASTQVNPSDNRMHFPDVWKTPYHQSFSSESVYATPRAANWQGDKLTDRLGTVLVDETPKPAPGPGRYRKP